METPLDFWHKYEYIAMWVGLVLTIVLGLVVPIFKIKRRRSGEPQPVLAQRSWITKKGVGLIVLFLILVLEAGIMGGRGNPLGVRILAGVTMGGAFLALIMGIITD